MRPSRIVVGEVRQAESLDLLIVLDSGLLTMGQGRFNSHARTPFGVVMGRPRASAPAAQRPTADAPAAHLDPHPCRVPGAPALERDSTRPRLLLAVSGRVVVQCRVLPSGVHAGAP
ncbi:MAG TPA: hypothetical protein VLQ78_04585 [Ornithinibacter sp.]|nr:hypothetical protein [Ornithinibacter sp.]